MIYLADATFGTVASTGHYAVRTAPNIHLTFFLTTGGRWTVRVREYKWTMKGGVRYATMCVPRGGRGCCVELAAQQMHGPKVGLE